MTPQTVDEGAFVNNNNTLFTEQKNSPAMLHYGWRHLEIPRQVVAVNSAFTLQIYSPDEEVVSVTCLSNGIEGDLTVTNIIGDYYEVSVRLSKYNLEYGQQYNLRLSIVADDVFVFNSEPFTTLTLAQEQNFYTDNDSLAIAYRDDTGLTTGYYWEEGVYNNLFLKGIYKESEEFNEDSETATGFYGNVEVLQTITKKEITYSFTNLPEYLLNNIVYILGSSILYVNGLRVVSNGVNLTENSQGLLTGSLAFSEQAALQYYNYDLFTNYNLTNTVEYVGDDNEDLLIDDNDDYIIFEY